MNGLHLSGRPTVKAFLRVIVGDWLTRMSGPLSVPFVFLALFFSGRTLRILFAILAVICGGFSAYWTWRKERLARIAVEEEFLDLRRHLKNEQAVLLADILAELQDNLKTALAPWTRSPFGQGVYIRPNDAAWKAHRSRVALPEKLKQDIQGVYDLVGRWISIVDTGVKPQLGSQDLETTAHQVSILLPGIISQVAAALPEHDS